MDLKYDLILNRFSVRRYRQKPLDASVLNNIKEYLHGADGLDNSNSFICKIYDYDNHQRSAGALGPFGRIFQAPHFLAPLVEGGLESLVDLGFRTQQIVLQLWSKGIGSCYIGCVHQQKYVTHILDLPENARIVSMVAFGIPSEDQSKYLYQKISQAFTRSTRRLDPLELFLDGSVGEFSNLSDTMKKIIEAGRQAPSATNAQPWRFKVSRNNFEIFIKRKTVGRIFDLDQEYALHDAGICMANMSMAAETLGRKIDWELLPIRKQNIKDGLLKIARYKIIQ